MPGNLGYLFCKVSLHPIPQNSEHPLSQQNPSLYFLQILPPKPRHLSSVYQSTELIIMVKVTGILLKQCTLQSFDVATPKASS